MYSKLRPARSSRTGHTLSRPASTDVGQRSASSLSQTGLHDFAIMFHRRVGEKSILGLGPAPDQKKPDDSSESYVSKRDRRKVTDSKAEHHREPVIYKRTRQRPKSPLRVDNWPIVLELSGKRFFDGSGQENATPEQNGDQPADDLTQDSKVKEEVKEDEQPKYIPHQLPPLQSVPANTKPSRHIDNTHKPGLSNYFYTDFGFKTNRTDTFSGHHKGRRMQEKSDLEKRIGETAKRHIYTCQVLGSSKRGSKAVESVVGLREAMSPFRSNSVTPSPLTSTRSMMVMRSHTNLLTDRSESVQDIRKKITIQIRTRKSGFLPSIHRQETDPLPEISGRTLILGDDGVY